MCMWSLTMTKSDRVTNDEIFLQGISKESLKISKEELGEKVAFCLPNAGRKTQFFQPLFSQPGKHSLEIPCT